jgi:iron complex outermembrane receptor protein
MPAATYLGLADAFPHWMQVMVDGRSVYNPAYGHVTWRGIPLTLDEVDRIEVVRGPNAAIDGLNSMLGTVHIYTRHTALTQGGMAQVVAGDMNTREANLRYGAQKGAASWRLGLLAREDERHGVAHDHATDTQMSFRLDAQPTHEDDVMLQLGLARGHWLGTNVGMVVSENQQADYLSGHANFLWKRSLGQGREGSLQAHHTFHQNAEDILPVLSGDYRTTASGLQFAYLDQSVPDLRTSLAAEYRLHRVRLPGLLREDGYVEDRILRASGALEWSPSPHWTVHAAAMIERHSDNGATSVSPRLALNWLPAREHAFRIGLSRAFSALGIYINNTDIELAKIRSSGTVDPERIDTAELGYLFSKPDWGVDLDVRAFGNRIEDIVVLVPLAPGSDVDTYANAAEARQRGVEYQLKWHPLPHGSLIVSQSWRDRDSGSGPNLIDSVPRQTLSLLASYSLAGVDASLGYYRIDDMFWIGGLRKPKSQYDRLDLRLATDWKTGDGTISIALGAQSLFGNEFESFAESPYRRQQFERRGYFSLKYEFK